MSGSDSELEEELEDGFSDAGFTFGIQEGIRTVKNITRSAKATTKKKYTRAGTYAKGGSLEKLKLPKAGAYAEAGVGKASAEWSIFEAKAKGPHAHAGAEISLEGARAMASASLASASAEAGPLKAKIGLGFDTGVCLGVNGFEAKIAGIGFSIGKKTNFLLLGNEISIYDFKLQSQNILLFKFIETLNIFQITSML